MNNIDFACVAVIVRRNAEYLLVEETKEKYRGMFNIPSGHVEASETVFDAAIREVKEESGYDIELRGLVGYYQNIFSEMNVAGLVFLGEVTGGEAIASSEHPSVVWRSEAQVNELMTNRKFRTMYVGDAIARLKTVGVVPLDIITVKDYSTS